MTFDAEQHCYEAFVSAIAEAVTPASSTMIHDDRVSHEDMLSGLASAHLHGVACAVLAIVQTTDREPEQLVDSMIDALHRHIAKLASEGLVS